MPEQVHQAHSVFISSVPYGSAQMKFIYLCSDASFNYNVNYNGSTTGMLGQDTDKAIFVDPSTGAVGSITINGVRANPATSTTAKNIEGTGIFSDALMSNAQMYSTICTMLKSNQMFQGAYILRIYNQDWSQLNKSGFDTNYRELYIHISSFKMDINWMNTNEASITLTAYRRYMNKGFGDI